MLARIRTDAGPTLKEIKQVDRLQRQKQMCGNERAPEPDASGQHGADPGLALPWVATPLIVFWHPAVGSEHRSLSRDRQSPGNLPEHLLPFELWQLHFEQALIQLLNWGVLMLKCYQKAM